MRSGHIAAAAALVAIGGVMSPAEEPRQAKRERIEAARAEIGLTDEQVTEIRRIRSEARKAAVRRHAELRVARMELRELMSAAALDEDKIAARVQAISELQTAALKQRTESQLAVRRLVTPEQFEKLQRLERRAWRGRRVRPGRHAAPERAPGGGGGDGLPPAGEL
jgi:Spy/CpxP family protein refolding chaperone